MSRALFLLAVLLAPDARSSPAAPPPVLTETFGDWVLIKSQLDHVLAARKQDFDPAYAKQTSSGGDPVMVPLYELVIAQGGDAGAALAVTAKPYKDKLRIYKKQESGVPMAVAVCAEKDGCADASKLQDVSARRCRQEGYDCRGAGELRFQGDWSRPLKVRTEAGGALLSASDAAIDKLPENRRLHARAMRAHEPEKFDAMMAEWQDGKSPVAALDAYHQAFAQGKPELKLKDGKPDALGSLHPLERAAIEQMPAAERQALLRKLETTQDKAQAEALLGQVRSSVSGYLGGNAKAMDQLKSAQFLAGDASKIFDRSQGGGDGPTVPAAGVQPPGAPAGQDARALINAPAGAGGAQVNTRTNEPPGAAAPQTGSGGGLLSNPWVTGIGGAVVGAVLGKMLFGAMLGGPMGLLVGMAMGAGIGMTLGNLFGGK